MHFCSHRFLQTKLSKEPGKDRSETPRWICLLFSLTLLYSEIRAISCVEWCLCLTFDPKSLHLKTFYSTSLVSIKKIYIFHCTSKKSPVIQSDDMEVGCYKSNPMRSLLSLLLLSLSIPTSADSIRKSHSKNALSLFSAAECSRDQICSDHRSATGRSVFALGKR